MVMDEKKVEINVAVNNEKNPGTITSVYLTQGM